MVLFNTDVSCVKPVISLIKAWRLLALVPPREQQGSKMSLIKLSGRPKPLPFVLFFAKCSEQPTIKSFSMFLLGKNFRCNKCVGTLV